MYNSSLIDGLRSLVILKGQIFAGLFFRFWALIHSEYQADFEANSADFLHIAQNFWMVLPKIAKTELTRQNFWPNLAKENYLDRKNNPDFLAPLGERLFSIVFFSWFSSVYSFDDLFKCRRPLGFSPVARVVCSQCYYFQHLYSGHKRPDFGAKMVSNFGQNEPNFPFPKAFFIFSIKMKQSDLTLHFHIFLSKWSKVT